jgi:hypothetical protein
VSSLRTPITAALAAIALVALAPPASARVVVGVNTYLPNEIQVGQVDVPASIAFTNLSRDADRTGTSRVTSIKISVSCANPSLNECTAADADPGVFSLSPAGTGRDGSACSGYLFTISEPDADNNVAVVPNAILRLAYNQTCVIDFTESAHKVPTVDVTSEAGTQTMQTAVVRLRHGTHSGWGAISQLTTVNP